MKFAAALVALAFAAAPCRAQEPSPWIKAADVSVKRPGGKILIWALPSAQARFGHPRSQTFNDDAARILSMLTGRMFVGDGGVAATLDKRKPEALFDPKLFSDGDARDDVSDPGKQRAKWNAAFALR